MENEKEQVVRELIAKSEGFILSEDTLKISDLLQGAFRFLHQHELNGPLMKDIMSLFQATFVLDVLCYGTYHDELKLDSSESASYLWNEDVFNYFNEIAPEGYYFGSSEGDGACIGWFKCAEEDSPPAPSQGELMLDIDTNTLHKFCVAGWNVAPSTINFSTKECPDILVLHPNGDIFVKGRLAENDKEVVDALRAFLQGQRFEGWGK